MTRSEEHEKDLQLLRDVVRERDRLLRENDVLRLKHYILSQAPEDAPVTPIDGYQKSNEAICQRNVELAAEELAASVGEAVAARKESRALRRSMVALQVQYENAIARIEALTDEVISLRKSWVDPIEKRAFVSQLETELWGGFDATKKAKQIVDMFEVHFGQQAAVQGVMRAIQDLGWDMEKEPSAETFLRETKAELDRLRRLPLEDLQAIGDICAEVPGMLGGSPRILDMVRHLRWMYAHKVNELADTPRELERCKARLARYEMYQ